MPLCMCSLVMSFYSCDMIPIITTATDLSFYHDTFNCVVIQLTMYFKVRTIGLWLQKLVRLHSKSSMTCLVGVLLLFVLSKCKQTICIMICISVGFHLHLMCIKQNLITTVYRKRSVGENFCISSGKQLFMVKLSLQLFCRLICIADQQGHNSWYKIQEKPRKFSPADVFLYTVCFRGQTSEISRNFCVDIETFLC